MRVKTFHLILIVFLVIPTLGLLYIQIIRGDYYYELGKKNYIRLIPQEAPRGRIFDRKGVILAENIPSHDLAILPQELKNIDLFFSELAKILKQDKKVLVKRYEKNYIAPFSPVTIAENLNIDEIVLLEESKSELQGLFIQMKPQRSYMYGEIVSHILGYIGLIDRSKITHLKDYGYKIKDIIGYTGIEEEYDRYLRGEDGGTQVEVDHRGRQKRILGMRAPRAGNDLELTLNISLQQAAYEALSGYKGAIIVMDSNNGDILTMASAPSYDNNIFADGDPDNMINRLFKDSDAPLLNRAISGLYPPGSIFKVITAIAAIEKNIISQDKTFLCTGHMQIGRLEFGCWSEHGYQNMRDAITHSCNVFFYNLGLLVGARSLNKYASEFGLGKITGLDLPNESAGNVSNPLKGRLMRADKWYDGNTANFSIGQGDLLTTPLQITSVMASIANGGKIVYPHLLLNAEDKNLIAKKEPIEINIKKENLKLLRSYLRRVVAEPSGTANILNLSDLAIAGKTGTAQSGKTKSHAWFAGFFPYDSPKIAFCVILEYGGSSYNACVVAKQFLRRAIDNKILDL